MPIYEFRCEDCGRVSDFLIISIHESFRPVCKYCKSRRMTRIISRVRVLRSEESRMESLADPSRWSGLDENDPASVARWMRKMGREMGEDISDEEIDEMIDGAMDELEGGGDGEGDGTDTETEG
ncbi:MAG: zinc ribbon domain-containing protein [Deltaproteobacteria bacterium]|nr:zinc ribbon domain-containing protein [Deltaproteobacteria bacterium]MBW2120290.1 zinc ribbon domain-containing protein [Deltaproteobacteria bacterium]